MSNVFISYSHDSQEHRRKVLGLSERLRQDGIETSLDQYLNGSPPEGWPRWMLNQLDAADSVLIVCSETYYRRFRGQEAPGIGKGVDWEGGLITQEIYDSRNKTAKFIPVLFADEDRHFIPEPLRSRNYYALTSAQNYQALYDVLLDQAGVEPGEVGSLKPRTRPKGAPLSFDVGSAISGPAPSESPRSPGQIVKLLVISASPRDRHVLAVDVEIREIKRAVRAATFRDRFQIVAETAVLADEFAGCVHNHAPQILHFTGYHSDDGGIMLMDESHGSKAVPKDALLHVLAGQRGLRLVVLNTCFSLPAAAALTQSIEFAIGVEDYIEDAASLQFAETLFAAIADGHPIESAYRQSITHMIGRYLKKNIPQLCTKNDADVASAFLA